MDFNISAFVEGLVKKAITRLFLSFIYVLEDLVADGRMSSEEFQRLRKRILDNGNNAVRDINTELQNFDFLLKHTDNKQQD